MYLCKKCRENKKVDIVNSKCIICNKVSVLKVCVVCAIEQNICQNCGVKK